MTETYTGRTLHEFVVESTHRYLNTVNFTSTRRSGFTKSVDELTYVPEAGAVLQIETRRGSQVTGLQDASGAWLFHDSDEELLEAEARRIESFRRSRELELERERTAWQTREDALPEWLRARMRRFHEAGGETFELEGWGYELVICELAVAYAAENDSLVATLDERFGCSGNQHDFAKKLAQQHLLEQSIDTIPAGLSPLTGSPDYAPVGGTNRA